MLDLEATKVTDGFVGALVGWKELRILVVRDTAVTERAIERIRDELPNVQVRAHQNKGQDQPD